jgi:hypothetical protein
MRSSFTEKTIPLFRWHILGIYSIRAYCDDLLGEHWITINGQAVKVTNSPVTKAHIKAAVNHFKMSPVGLTHLNKAFDEGIIKTDKDLMHSLAMAHGFNQHAKVQGKAKPDSPVGPISVQSALKHKDIEGLSKSNQTNYPDKTTMAAHYAKQMLSGEKPEGAMEVDIHALASKTKVKGVSKPSASPEPASTSVPKQNTIHASVHASPLAGSQFDSPGDANGEHHVSINGKIAKVNSLAPVDYQKAKKILTAHGFPQSAKTPILSAVKSGKISNMKQLAHTLVMAYAANEYGKSTGKIKPHLPVGPISTKSAVDYGTIEGLKKASENSLDKKAQMKAQGIYSIAKHFVSYTSESGNAAEIEVNPPAESSASQTEAPSTAAGQPAPQNGHWVTINGKKVFIEDGAAVDLKSAKALMNEWGIPASAKVKINGAIKEGKIATKKDLAHILVMAYAANEHGKETGKIKPGMPLGPISTQTAIKYGSLESLANFEHTDPKALSVYAKSLQNINGYVLGIGGAQSVKEVAEEEGKFVPDSNSWSLFGEDVWKFSNPNSEHTAYLYPYSSLEGKEKYVISMDGPNSKTFPGQASLEAAQKTIEDFIQQIEGEEVFTKEFTPPIGYEPLTTGGYQFKQGSTYYKVTPLPDGEFQTSVVSEGDDTIKANHQTLKTAFNHLSEWYGTPDFHTTAVQEPGDSGWILGGWGDYKYTQASTGLTFVIGSSGGEYGYSAYVMNSVGSVSYEKYSDSKLDLAKELEAEFGIPVPDDLTGEAEASTQESKETGEAEASPVSLPSVKGIGGIDLSGAVDDDFLDKMSKHFNYSSQAVDGFKKLIKMPESEKGPYAKESFIAGNKKLFHDLTVIAHAESVADGYEDLKVGAHSLKWALDQYGENPIQTLKETAESNPLANGGKVLETWKIVKEILGSTYTEGVKTSQPDESEPTVPKSKKGIGGLDLSGWTDKEFFDKLSGHIPFSSVIKSIVNDYFNNGDDVLPDDFKFFASKEDFHDMALISLALAKVNGFESLKVSTATLENAIEEYSTIHPMLELKGLAENGTGEEGKKHKKVLEEYLKLVGSAGEAPESTKEAPGLSVVGKEGENSAHTPIKTPPPSGGHWVTINGKKVFITDDSVSAGDVDNWKTEFKLSENGQTALKNLIENGQVKTKGEALQILAIASANTKAFTAYNSITGYGVTQAAGIGSVVSLKDLAESGNPLAVQTLSKLEENSFKSSVEANAEKMHDLSAEGILDKKLSGAKGGNEGGFYESKNGEQYYVKFYKDPDRVHTEHIANAIYNQLGLFAPQSGLLPHGGKEGPGKLAYASKVMDLKGTLGEIGLTKSVAQEVLKGFVADVFLSNWDVVGANKDNIVIGADGKVIRIDNGSAIHFRALGEKKPESDLLALGEWQNFAPGGKSSQYHPLFTKAGYKGAEDIPGIAKQIGEILSLRSKYGSWEKFIEKVSPNTPNKVKKEIAGILEKRTELLKDKRKELLGSSSVADTRQFVYHGESSKYDTTKYSKFVSEFKGKNPPITKDEAVAIAKFKGEMYGPINDFLRGKSTGTPIAKKYAKNIQSALEKCPQLGQDMFLSRKFTPDSKGLIDIKNAEEGDTWTDPGVLSHAIDSRIWYGNVHFRVKVPKEAKYICPSAYTTSNYSEKELTFKNVTYRILKVHEKKSGYSEEEDEEMKGWYWQGNALRVDVEMIVPGVND